MSLAYLSRIAVDLMAPLNLILIVIMVSLCLLIFRQVRAGIAILMIGVAALLLAGYGFGVRGLIEKKEYAYLPLSDASIKSLKSDPISYIVVLGSGHVSDPRLVETSQIGGASLYRLIEGIKLSKHFPGSKLVIMGGAVYDPIPNAHIVAAVAKQLGMEDSRMIVEKSPQNTIEEAELAARIIGENAFILVTSAMHMGRAMEIFRSHGLSPVPAPTDYITKRVADRDPARYLPSAANLELSKGIMYEWIGSLYIKLKQVLEDHF